MKNRNRGWILRANLLSALAAFLLFGSYPAEAGFIASESTITSIKNVTGNMPQFAVFVTGGTGPCLNTWVVFPVSAAPDADTHKRAYATAMMAIALGMHVIIYNYTDDSCLGASYIDAHY